MLQELLNRFRRLSRSLPLYFYEFSSAGYRNPRSRAKLRKRGVASALHSYRPSWY